MWEVLSLLAHQHLQHRDCTEIEKLLISVEIQTMESLILLDTVLTNSIWQLVDRGGDNAGIR